MSARTTRPRRAWAPARPLAAGAASAVLATALTAGLGAPALATTAERGPAAVAAPVPAALEAAPQQALADETSSPVPPLLIDGADPVDGGWSFWFASQDEEIAGWEYALDGGEPTAFAGLDGWNAELRLSGLEPGEHTLVVRATSTSGGVAEIERPFVVEAAGPDTVPPLVLDTTRTFEDGAWTFRFTMDEDIALWEHSLDLAPRVSFAGTDARNAVLRFAGLEPGPHAVEIWAADAAGNTVWYRWVFNVDGPVVTPTPTTPTAPTPTTPTTPAPAPAPVPAPVAAPVTPALTADAVPAAQVARGIARGSSGASVALIQRLVGAAPDGVFGPRTAAAVRAFQRAHGLVPDGVVGPLTWAALVDVANGGSGTTALPVPRAVLARGVARGAHGQAVVSIQRLVGTAPDGIFGPRTRAAVREWQRTHGLVTDGVVGPLTWASLTAPR